MKSVGIRELKARLSHHVREAAAGRPVRVTNRGTLVAILREPRAAVTGIVSEGGTSGERRRLGLRNLKAGLSDALRRLRNREILEVTDRGRTVAVLEGRRGAAGLPPEFTGLQDLIDRGLVSQGAPNDPSLYQSTGISLPREDVQRMLDELREDRC